MIAFRFGSRNQLRQRLRLHHGAGRIGRTADHHAGKRLFLMGSDQRLARQGPACFRGSFDQHRLAAERAENMPIRRIAGIGQRHALARFEQRKERQNKTAGRAGGDHNARRIELKIVGVGVVASDARPQRRNTQRLGIADASAIERGLRGGDGRARRRRRRLAHLHMHDAAALGLDSRRRHHHVHDNERRHLAAFGGR